jgi:UDP-N-acetylglucosamine 1-carboxyvinyltransferase
MNKIIINGGKKLCGEIEIAGAKNSALPILFSTLLTDESTKITNVPSLTDIDVAVEFLNFIGKKTIKIDNIVNTFPSKNNYKYIAPYDLVKKMRASILAIGPLLARLKKAFVSFPGGCSIGDRPIDMHINAFKKMGAEIFIKNGYIEAFANNGLKGAIINLKIQSVGATENILLSSVLAYGVTIITNAACEPEIDDLINVLNSMGAKIIRQSEKKIIINGVKKLNGFNHKLIPDRIEAATYIIASAITKGEIFIKNVIPNQLRIVLEKLKKSGLYIEESENIIYAKWINNLCPQNIKTEVYPGFPTDVQAQWMVLMSLLNGISFIEENIFENRFMHVAELKRLGANIHIDGKIVTINGVAKLSGAQVMMSDIRAGAALVLAGLAAEGKTIISRIYHLDRGYYMFEKNLQRLGADITRI